MGHDSPILESIRLKGIVFTSPGFVDLRPILWFSRPDLLDQDSGLEDFSESDSSISFRLLLGIWLTIFNGDLRLFDGLLAPFLESSTSGCSVNIPPQARAANK